MEEVQAARSISRNKGVIAAGLALFSMFFGAGDLIWPLILGGEAGHNNVYAMVGLLITGVSLPLLGLMAMMLFEGDFQGFFRQIGRVPGLILLFIIQAILGPIGSIPRLMTLAHATLQPYLPSFFTLALFSVFAAILVFFFTIRKNRIVDIIGLFLCPVLLIALGSILILGFINPPSAQIASQSANELFFSGIKVGYNTLDLIASFIFAPLVLTHFLPKGKKIDSTQERKFVFKKMVKASLLAGGLLATMYIGLTYVASLYTPILPAHLPEGRLAAISLHLLGPIGALFSCIAVSLACLTTAIPITVVSADYIHGHFMRGRGSINIAIAISLGISMLMANLGFMGIANALSPILQVICPGLIILSVLSILHKLYEIPLRKLPIFAAFAISLGSYLAGMGF